MILIVTAVVFAVIGLALGGGGGYLLSLGGSPFYLIAGLAFILVALLLVMRKASALWIYGLFILGCLGWAIWEVGFDWWQLGTRGGLVIVLGFVLLLPAIRRRLGPLHRREGGIAASAWPVALPVLVALVVAGYSMTQDPYDKPGTLPMDVASATPSYGGDMADGEWHQYGRTPYGQRYSPLTQITTDNVKTLKTAWTYQTGDVKQPGDVGETTYQVTPLKVGDTLYLCTPHNWAIAVDAATGKQKWKYDPNVGLNPDRQHQTCRGVTYYADPAATSGAPCATRVYLPTSDARLIALDAANGKICESFADKGVLHLEQGMPYNPAGYYYSTSPPVIAAGKIIIGGAVNDNYSTKEQSGVIRAFDVQTGALVWNWDSGNPGQTQPLPQGQTYTANSPNSWSVFSVDEQLGLVYIPLGNQVPDQLGMNRSANVEKYSSSVVALDLNTGADRWVQQFVHHDLWDMDVPAQPVLLDIVSEGTTVPALVASTKQGDVYVLDRRTGQPIIPIKELPAPGGTIPEDHASPTQPISALSFRPPKLEERNMWGVTLLDQLACRIKFHQLRYEGQYTPPSLQGSIIYPGNFGTFNWGSVAVDPEKQVMFGMPTYLAFTSQLVPRDQVPAKGQDEKGSEQGLNRNDGAPYAVKMGPFLSPIGIPCQAPPWGTVAAVDLKTGKIAYQHRNGTVHDMTPLPLPFKVGVPGIGGPMITKGGVAFLGAAVDNYLRAYDLATGKVLWEGRLPAGGQATPMSYELNGKQYVVMVAGGHGSVGTKPGDYVIAYTLP
ncbi:MULTISPECIES: glucose/quinate/shikimate family membrane-bound PQQ-dependent dehydrogenase [Rhizobium/Agrobacterium group]|uniref:glucose/quinate/shikimate family membrane-bound PQQ-dependent dehydrogenase n=1 Tax=Rhizobium/Agrobacterium group TaxID=227290 RepID=UPI000B40373D|nr:MULTISPECIES: glucose/quinate/shikimate family membrane-bound PQQ-dependent dehydrogenase [Rhizobium/Agrobacterium group]MCF1484461.1 glucose/quinate/shikimate family membrane-bound PQQ-dependent dehydrogenase [Allorhizobium ampelinum]NSZ43232.1 glucose/quinate/shikimate family membrane-bound PQQ-dependent dehydrogenase [Agrobacterium vitis]NTA26889.1 glucose/quinate/shikimate family membrane-bound PQQ-dependent dehydrogenase [Allorhizobium ampelinum]OVE94706.1 membrane-bound PQQ-dependent d